ncbi:penicillin-binding protein [Cellulomonas cellasea]|uniref:Membrane peptidoglycan carboxypeptidase n=1 Tax=Cellulomonas cellasea TaxID=43670 RepID=A0A7W4YCP9_9CELL|nr:penicillin-binding protein [Cellulomonas cellasea]MBB2925240.1 membrane peptidoglycan carboxypeptidase [Cellulomonas cellasea]
MASSNRRAPAPSRRRATRVASAPVAGRAEGRRRFFDYPRSGYEGLHRWLPSWRFVLGSFLTVCFLGLGALVAAYAVTKIPDAAEDAKFQASTVYYAPPEGSPEGTPGAPIATFAEQKRELVDLSTLQDYVGDAVIASEDRTFWENSGISPRGIVRALWNNVRGGDTQGASTLTQQYVERYYTGKTTSDYLGKARETLLAVKISQSQEKPEILERYLNTIYFGRDSYGIQTAAKSYFGKNAAELSLSEAAMLAGIIPSPNNWDPAESPEKAQQRWERVLNIMVDDGHITAEERAAAVFPTDSLVPYTRSNTLAGPTGYILELVKDELEAKGITEDILYTGGLQIITTIQQPLQASVQANADTVWDGSLAGGTPDVEHFKMGIVSLDTRDGAIVAMYGGRDFLTDQINRVTRDKAQAGSTFKPFTLIAALEQGISLETRLSGASPLKLDSWGPEEEIINFGETSLPEMNLADATADSVNTVYAQLNDMVTPQKTAEVAKRAGITTDLVDKPSNVLGPDAVHPLDMASAYATIASGGVYHKPFIVREARYVADPDTVAYRGGTDEPKQVFAPEVMADTTYAMTQVVEKGSGETYVKPLGRPIAGKTGTSSDNLSAWFVGFTPQIATAVAFSQVGENMSDPVKITKFGVDSRGREIRQITGGSWPAALWANYMNAVFQHPPYAEVKPFPKRANVGKKPTPTATATETEAPVETQPPAETQVAVPGGLEGKTQADAEAAVVNAGLSPAVSQQASETVAAGRVISASPGGGTMVNKGSAVAIVVSTGPAKKPTPTPAPTQTQQPQPTPTQPTPPADGAGGAGGAGAGGGAGGGNGG